MMRRLMFPAVLIALLGTTWAGATVITFDDVATTNAVLVPNGYHGFDWNNFYVHQGTPAGSGYDTGRVSGDYVAYNGYGNTAAASNTLFDFNGAYLTGAWNNGLNITVQGYLGANLLYDQTVVVDTTGPTWFQFDYVGIDKVQFTSFGGVDVHDGGSGTQFAMDNFTYNETNVVPAPGAFALGLIGIGCVNRIRRRK